MLAPYNSVSGEPITITDEPPVEAILLAFCNQWPEGKFLDGLAAGIVEVLPEQHHSDFKEKIIECLIDTDDQCLLPLESMGLVPIHGEFCRGFSLADHVEFNAGSRSYPALEEFFQGWNVHIPSQVYQFVTMIFKTICLKQLPDSVLDGNMFTVIKRIKVEGPDSKVNSLKLEFSQAGGNDAVQIKSNLSFGGETKIPAQTFSVVSFSKACEILPADLSFSAGLSGNLESLDRVFWQATELLAGFSPQLFSSFMGMPCTVSMKPGVTHDLFINTLTLALSSKVADSSVAPDKVDTVWKMLRQVNDLSCSRLPEYSLDMTELMKLGRSRYLTCGHRLCADQRNGRKALEGEWHPDENELWAAAVIRFIQVWLKFAANLYCMPSQQGLNNLVECLDLLGKGYVDVGAGNGWLGAECSVRSQYAVVEITDKHLPKKCWDSDKPVIEKNANAVLEQYGTDKVYLLGFPESEYLEDLLCNAVNKVKKEAACEPYIFLMLGEQADVLNSFKGQPLRVIPLNFDGMGYFIPAHHAQLIVVAKSLPELRNVAGRLPGKFLGEKHQWPTPVQKLLYLPSDGGLIYEYYDEPVAPQNGECTIL